MSVTPRADSSKAHALSFILGVSLATAGGAVALISATGVTTSAGGGAGGAFYSGVYLAISFASGAIAVPFAQVVGHRLGTRRAFLGMLATMALAWTAGGLLIIAGLPGLGVVLVVGLVTGVAGGMSSVLAPIVYRSYLSSVNVESAVAHMTAYKGLAGATGALLAGSLLSSGSLALGMIVAGLAKVPIVLVLARQEPSALPPDLVRTPHAWFGLLDALRTSVNLRFICVISVGTALFVTPILTMAVPISQALRPTQMIQGAGLLIAGYALGEVLAPVLVTYLGRGRQPVAATALAEIMAGLAIVILGVVSLCFSRQTELALWVVAAIAIAAFRYASLAFNLGAAAESLGAGRAATGLAVVRLCGGLTAPIGVLGWSLLLGSVGPARSAIASGIGMAVIALVVLGASSRHPATCVSGPRS